MASRPSDTFLLEKTHFEDAVADARNGTDTISLWPGLCPPSCDVLHYVHVFRISCPGRDGLAPDAMQKRFVVAPTISRGTSLVAMASLDFQWGSLHAGFLWFPVQVRAQDTWWVCAALKGVPVGPLLCPEVFPCGLCGVEGNPFGTSASPRRIPVRVVRG